MPSEHPVEGAIKAMSPRDREIAEQLRQLGYGDEALYAALCPAMKRDPVPTPSPTGGEKEKERG